MFPRILPRVLGTLFFSLVLSFIYLFFFFIYFFPEQLLSGCFPLCFQNYYSVVVNITKLYIVLLSLMMKKKIQIKENWLTRISIQHNTTKQPSMLAPLRMLQHFIAEQMYSNVLISHMPYSNGTNLICK